MSRFTAWDAAVARDLLRGMAGMPGAALVMLQALQAHFGYVHAEAVPLVAEALNLSRAEVHGVLGFYHDLLTAPPPARVVRLCRAEACQAVGSEALVAAAARLGFAIDAPAQDAMAALRSVYCLGNCALGPAATVDGELVAHMNAGKLAAILSNALPGDLQVPV